jgi:hypothetical protein
MVPPERVVDLLGIILHHRAAIQRTFEGGTLRRMGLIYKPFAVIIGLIGGIVGRKIFDFVWTKLDDQEPPGALTEETTWPRLLAAAAIQGMIFRVTRYVIERHGAIGFRYLTGFWPGPKQPDPDD